MGIKIDRERVGFFICNFLHYVFGDGGKIPSKRYKYQEKRNFKQPSKIYHLENVFETNNIIRLNLAE